MNRRSFLSLSALAAGAAVANTSPLSALAAEDKASTPGSFDYIFLTDTHLEPELAAADGCSMAFKKAASLHADFAIQGGDHVFDALAVDRKRADSLFDLYAHTEQALGLKVHHAIGNHDHFGIFNKTGIETSTPGYGKQMFIDRVGPTYQSWDHKGYHFVIIDTIQVTEDRSWEARVDDKQLTWLEADLAKLPKGTPVIVTCHVPLITAADQYEAPDAPSGSGVAKPAGIVHPQLSVANAYQVRAILEKHAVLAVFQGHTHINEDIKFHGIHYVTSGAVCGNWWHGTRWGIPEGFTVVSLRNGKIDWRYETYGFKSVDPKNT
jgi:3',5'-cyclic-AMP phosphodiesterase